MPNASTISTFLVPTVAQGVTLSVCLFVPDKVLILLISGSYLPVDFKMTS